MRPSSAQCCVPDDRSAVHVTIGNRRMRATRPGRLGVHPSLQSTLGCRRRRQIRIRCHSYSPKKVLGRMLGWGESMLYKIAPELEPHPSHSNRPETGESAASAEGSNPSQPEDSEGVPLWRSRDFHSDWLFGKHVREREERNMAAAKAMMLEQLLAWTNRVAEQNPNPTPVAPRSRVPPPPRERPPQLGQLVKAFAVIAETAIQQRIAMKEEQLRRLQEAQLEARRQSYRHLRLQGEITLDWPPPTVPTWDAWLERFEETDIAQEALEVVKDGLRDAELLGHYKEAAGHRKKLEEIQRHDNVHQAIQTYREALKREDYAEAAELGSRAGLSLLGWWWPQNTNCENPSHLMRVSAAFDRYVFEVFTPDDIARIHGVKAPPNNEPGAPYSYEEFTPHPDLGQYKHEGNLVAELHYKGFQVVGGEEEEGEESDAEESGSDDSEDEEQGGDDEEFETVVHEQATALALADHLLFMNKMYGVPPSPGDDNGEGQPEEETTPQGEGQPGDGWNVTASGGAGDEGIKITIKGDMGRFFPKTMGVIAGDDAAGMQSWSTPRFHQPDEYTYLDRSGGETGEASGSDNEDGDESSTQRAEGNGSESGSDRDGSDTEEPLPYGLGSDIQRIPAQIIRFEDRDRFMLRVLPTTDEQASIEESREEWEASRAEAAAEETQGEEPQGEDDGEVSDETTDRLRRLIRQKLRKTQEEGGRLVRPEAVQEGEGEPQGGMEIRIPQTLITQTLMQLAGGQAVSSEPEIPEYQYGLRGSTSYKRIPASMLGAQHTDPFTGIFLRGSATTQDPDILRLQRVKQEDGKEIVEAIKLTGEEASCPVGEVVFRAAIGRRHRLPLHDTYHSPIDIKARYKGKTLVRHQGNEKDKWTEGELLEFGDVDYFAGAELGFTTPYGTNQDSVLYLLHRITLDDPLAGVVDG